MMIYKPGKAYTLQTSLKVRSGAGLNYSQKLTTQLSTQIKPYAYEQTYAVLKKGTCITTLKIITVGNQVWAQISGGYIMLQNGDTYYAK